MKSTMKRAGRDRVKSRRLYGHSLSRDAQGGTAALQKWPRPTAAVMPTKCDTWDVVKYGVQGTSLVRYN